MKHVFLIPLVAALFAANSFAQDRIYRCGNEYTNTVPSAQTRGCKLMDGGNVTVVQGTRSTSEPTRGVVASATSSKGDAGQRINAGEQKSRDSDARQIFESELKKAEVRHKELLKDYSNGAPDTRGDETRTSPRYLERVAELKASLARNESDIAGIRRELGRVSPMSASK